MEDGIRRFSLLLVIVLTVKVSCESVRTCDSYTCSLGCATCTSNGTCCTCIPGKYGLNCSQNCHWDCLTCSSSGVCDTCRSNLFFGPLCDQPCELCNKEACNRYECSNGCKDGFYQTSFPHIPLESNYFKCVKCPESCTLCKSHIYCTGCIGRRWDRKCESLCLGNCDTCDQRTGECVKTECVSGQYLDKGGRCKRCPETCSACQSYTDCTECVGEHQGKTCDSVNCSILNNCQECTCSSNACVGIKCIKCEDGYTGDSCQRIYAGTRNITKTSTTEIVPKTNNLMFDGSTGPSLVYEDPMHKEDLRVGAIICIAAIPGISVVIFLIVYLYYRKF